MRKQKSFKWDCNDNWLIVGLAFLGTESETFKRAPEDCKKAVLAYLKSGTPTAPEETELPPW